MKHIIERLPTTINYSASAAQPLVIGAKSYWITGMLLDFEIAKTDSTSPTTYQDFLFRTVTSLTLMGGNKPYVQIGGPDLRVLYWATRHRLAGRHKAPDMQAGSVTFRAQVPILFGVNPLKYDDKVNLTDDVTAGIAPDDDLTLTLTWGANTAIGTNRTVGTGSLVRVSLIGAIPATPAEQPKWRPAWQGFQWAPSQTYAGLSGIVQLPTGFVYRRTTLMFLNGSSPSDVRTDGLSSDAISEIGIQTADGRYPLALKTWDFSKMSQGFGFVQDDNTSVPGATAAYGASVVTGDHNPGTGQIDWLQFLDKQAKDRNGRPIADPTYGLDLRNKDKGSVNIATTVDTATNTNLVGLHECYLPYT